MNFKLLIGGGIGIFLLGGALGAWVHHRLAPPIIKYQDKIVEKVVEREGKTQIKEVDGPVRIQTVTRTVQGPEHTVERIVTRTEQRDPVVIERASTTAMESRTATQVVTLEKPAPELAGWALGAGLGIVPEYRAHVALARRLFGPVWVEAWADQPLKLAVPSAGVGLRVEF